MPEPAVHVQSRVDASDVLWFERNFPSVTKAAFIAGCFRYLRLLVEKGEIPRGDSFIAQTMHELIREKETRNDRRTDASSDPRVDSTTRSE